MSQETVILGRFPSFESIMDSQGKITGMKDLPRNCVYAVVDRRNVADCCVCTLRDKYGKESDIWASTALREKMVGDGMVEKLPVWIAVAESKSQKKYIPITFRKFTEEDFELNPWALKVKQRKIPPVCIEDDEKPSKAHKRRRNWDLESDEGIASDSDSSEYRSRSKRIHCQFK